MHFTEKTFDTDRVTLNYAEGPPNGPPLLLLHGLATRWQSWLPVMPTLAERWHVIALDHRGHGKSGRVPGRYLPLDYVADTRAFVAGLFDTPVHLLGSSMGAGVALHLAGTQPKAVRSVINGDMPLSFDRIMARSSTEDFQAYYSAHHEHAGKPVADLIPWLREQGTPEHQLQNEAETLSQLDPDTLSYHVAGQLSAYLIEATRFPLERIKCPVLLLQGSAELGGLLSDEDVALARTVVSQVEHVRLEQAGHGLGLWNGATGPLIDAVTAFLDAV